MNKLDVSIIIPTYKPQGYIFECLNSVKNQSMPSEKFEVIVILNGERNPYYDNIDNYINKEFIGVCVKLFFTEFANVSNARNIGIEASDGKYLAFIDDDDIISPNYLSALFEIAVKNMISLSYVCPFKEGILNVLGKHARLYERRSGRKNIILNVRAYFSNAVYKLIDREIIGRRRFNINFINGEDALFMFLISDNINKIEFADKSAVYYRRIREDSLSRKESSYIYKLKNVVLLVIEYTRIFFSRFGRYSVIFYLTRVLATLRILITLKKSYN
jgi:glycosyltransferase involved in cell wall biosynthesis